MLHDRSPVRPHEVITAVALAAEHEASRAASTSRRDVSQADCGRSARHTGRAVSRGTRPAAYAVQGLAAMFVSAGWRAVTRV